MYGEAIAKCQRATTLLRFILGFFGGIFSMVTLGLMMVALGVGAIFWMYGRDLPSHESLAQYSPPTISRIYSGEGRMIDEFAEERRLFAPIEDIPDLVQERLHLGRGQELLDPQGL